MPSLSIAAPARTATAASATRLSSIDLLRGLVIVLMVLDHVRDFLYAGAWGSDPLDPAHTTGLLYATRWITHLCAPTFVFLAGASAWLQRERGKSAPDLARFLLARGLWLVFLELTLVGFAWSFSLPFLLALQVIWAIGWSMVGLAALVRLPRAAVLVLGLLIIAGHNLLDPLLPARFGNLADVWMALHAPGLWRYHGMPFAFDAYPVLPWLGVMLLGYGLAPWFLLPAAPRDRRFLSLGAALLALFLLLRYFNGYGDPQPWTVQASFGQSVMSFLRVQKYPPSLFYVCATLGLMFLSVPLVSRWRGPLARVVLVFGSVPLFAYVLHLYLAHALAILLRLATGQSIAGQIDLVRVQFTHPELLAGTGFSLAVVYATWIAVLVILYPLCRWYSRLRQRHRDWWWLSYL
jgi:uncharacterized membrane protein